MRATSVLALAVIFATSSVRAADGAGATGTTDEALAAEAKKHYEEGTKAFNLAEFARAIAEFKIAYNAKPEPLLLYNIGQAFRLAGDDGQALLFYRSFLRNMPDAPNRRELEGRIRTLEKRVAEQKAAGQAQNASASRNKEAGAIAAAAAPVPISRAPADALATPPEVSPPPPAAMAPQATRVAPAAAWPAGPQPTPGSGNATATPLAASTGQLGLAAPATGAAAASERHADISMAPAPATREGGENDDKPIYKRWWFWAGVAAVALVGIAVAANANKAPSTTLGLYQPAFR